MGLEEHLVQKICMVYTKIIQTGWCFFVKVLGSWPLAWASSQENNSLHSKGALIWVSPVDRAATRRVTYSSQRKEVSLESSCHPDSPHNLYPTVRGTHEQLLVTKTSSLGLCVLMCMQDSQNGQTQLTWPPTIPPRPGPFLHSPKAGVQVEHKPQSFSLLQPQNSASSLPIC